MLLKNSEADLRGAPAPLLPKTPWSPPHSPKILETIDEGREGARKKKDHQPPCLSFLASPLQELIIVIEYFQITNN